MIADVPRTALITGASAGIGEAFAEVFAADGFDLVVVARRVDRLEALAARLTARHGIAVHVLPADLARPDAAATIVAALESRGLVIDALVNNAGYGVPGSYTSASWERQHALLQVMVIALSELTYRLLPGMVGRRYGRIINVASLAGLVPPAAGHTLYAASKAFVIKFSEALAHEVRQHGVHVTALCPGFTLSEFHDITGTREMMNRMPRWIWSDSRSVARAGHAAVMAGHPVYIPGGLNRGLAVLVRLLPQRFVQAAGRRAGRAYRKV
jgi:short-subunit dehydrogenase